MKRLSTIWRARAWLVLTMSQGVASLPAAIPARAMLKAVVRIEIQTRGVDALVPFQERADLRLLFSQAGPASSSSPTSPAGREAPPRETSEEPLWVSDISITPGLGGKVVINVTTTKPVPYHVLRLDDPDRLVVDLEGVRYQFGRNSFPVSSPVVRQVRVGQFKEKDPEVVRVVADLSGDPVFETRAFTGGVRIEVEPHPKAAPVAAAPASTPIPEAAARRDEGNPIQPAGRAAERTGASHINTHQEPALDAASSRPSPADALTGPEPNRLRRNSAPVASPVTKAARADQSQTENPAGMSTVDDILRYLFGEGTPAPATPTPLATGPGPRPIKRLDGPSQVSDISVNSGPGGEITIAIVMTKSAPFQVLRISDPDRLAVDVRGATNGLPRDSIPVVSPLVKGVRVGQRQEGNLEVVRVVLDLAGNPMCDAGAYTGGVRIAVKPRPVANSDGPGTAASAKTR